ncbi:hypothetical protein BD779DRAFT_1485717 [Infundibulicybe gibba]|nr:hypothetical protein BD779DRAFT_1485717 [Infundibulicybe gibba]
MANVLHPHIDFHPSPVSHAPSPFGFGFGLTHAPPAGNVGWQPSASTTGHTNPSAFQQLASAHYSSTRAQKRSREPEEGPDASRTARDDLMDRSPTPERLKRAAPKRARLAPSVDNHEKSERVSKDKESTNESDGVDVGVLLASLPPQSLLPLLMSLLHSQPSLKTNILQLLPRPTLETATQALARSSKQLRDAYPYSNSSPMHHSPPSTTAFGFGSEPNGNRSGPVLAPGNGGMRDSYITSRLRPHISDFVAACISYLPYFSLLPSPTTTPPLHPQSHVAALQTLHKDRHPSESFIFLSSMTNHLLSQPPLTQSSLWPLLLPRLLEEWKAWVDRVDQVVNQEGGMFGSETVRAWERGLDEMAESKFCEGTDVMRMVRDRWVTKVGWLVGRIIQQPMEEL